MILGGKLFSFQHSHVARLKALCQGLPNCGHFTGLGTSALKHCFRKLAFPVPTVRGKSRTVPSLKGGGAATGKTSYWKGVRQKGTWCLLYNFTKALPSCLSS